MPTNVENNKLSIIVKRIAVVDSSIGHTTTLEIA